MQTDQTPGQPPAFQPDDEVLLAPTSAHFAGECGDPIWESRRKARRQERQQASTAANQVDAIKRELPADPGREESVPAGRIINLDERPRRKD